MRFREFEIIVHHDRLCVSHRHNASVGVVGSETKTRLVASAPFPSANERMFFVSLSYQQRGALRQAETSAETTSERDINIIIIIMAFSPHPNNFASQRRHQRHNKYCRHYTDDDDHGRTAAGLVEDKPVSFRNEWAVGNATPFVPNDAIVDVRNDGHSSYSHRYYQHSERSFDDDSSFVTSASSVSPSLVATHHHHHHLQQQSQPQRFFNGRPVKAKNQHLPDHVLEFKQQRKMRTAASAWTGAVVGLVSLGPVGAVVGATAAYGIAKGVGKARERKLIATTTDAVKDVGGPPTAPPQYVADDCETSSTTGTGIVSSPPPLLQNAVMA
jgi:hypothetical protein